MPSELSVTFNGDYLLDPERRAELSEVLGKLAANQGFELRHNNTFDRLLVTPDDPWLHHPSGFSFRDFHRLPLDPTDRASKASITTAHTAIARHARRLGMLHYPDSLKLVPRGLVQQQLDGTSRSATNAGTASREVYEALLLTSRPAAPKEMSKLLAQD